LETIAGDLAGLLARSIQVTAQDADLWGDLEDKGPLSPRVILKQQADLLGDKTKHLVEADVRTESNGRIFFHSFVLLVKGLDNYKHELLTVSHGISLYPVTTSSGRRLETPQQFKNWLQENLSASATKRVVTNLMSLAQE